MSSTETNSNKRKVSLSPDDVTSSEPVAQRPRLTTPTIIPEQHQEDPIPAALGEQKAVIRKVLTEALFSDKKEAVKDGLKLIIRYANSSNNVNHSRDIKKFVFSAGLASIVGTMKKWIGSQSLQSEGCGAINNILFDDSSNKSTVAFDVGVVDTVLGAMKAFPNHDRIQYLACQIIVLLRKHPNWRETLSLDPELIDMVVSAMKRFPNHRNLQRRASQLLKHLSDIEGEMKEKIRESEAPELLLAAIRTFKNDTNATESNVLQEARAALRQLV